MRSFFTLLLTSLTLLSGIAHADGRPWGVVMPFGNGAPSPSGFQGIYNPWSNGIEMETPASATAPASTQVQKPPAPVQKRIQQGWQNIYRPRPTGEGDVWPDAQKSTNKGDDTAQKRMFGNTSLSDEEQEQWPDRRKPRSPYRSTEAMRYPFGGFAPNMMPQAPNMPYGGYIPYGPNGSRY